MRAGWQSVGPEVRLGLVAALVAIAWCVLTLDPTGPATIDPDASSSVLYFQRIVGGHQLEAFVPTTPKPLLTILYGLSWGLLSDWRLLVWETIVAWGLAVGATAAFAARVASRLAAQVDARGGAAGGTLGRTGVAIAAGAFTAAALLGDSDLMLEVSRANSLVWALLGWSVAGLAVTARPMRPRLAGLALLLAGLCRFETLALTALAIVVVALWSRRARRGGEGAATGHAAGRGPGDAGVEPVLVPGFVETAEQLDVRRAGVRARAATGPIVGALLAVAALPLALLHDWLLSGDPLYWLSVPSRYTTTFVPGLESVGPVAYAGTLLARLGPEWPLLLLAVAGIAALVRGRAWLTLAGIAAVGLGEIALLFWLAFRATYISNRYYEPIDLALIVAAGIGVGWAVSRLVALPGVSARLRAARRGAAPIAAGLAVAAVVVGLVVTWPALPWDRRATIELTDVRRASTHLMTIQPTLEDTLSAGVTQLLVPSRDVSRFCVQTGESLERIINSYAVLVNGGPKALVPGQVLFHDAAADRPGSMYRPLEVDPEATLDGVELVRLEPRLAEIWLLSVR